MKRVIWGAAIIVAACVGVAFAEKCNGEVYNPKPKDAPCVTCEQTVVNNYQTTEQVTKVERVEPKDTFLQAYLGADQNLWQMTNNVHLAGQVRYQFQQNGVSDHAYVGLVITNAKPLVDTRKK